MAVRPRRRFVPLLESLEDRRLLSTDFAIMVHFGTTSIIVHDGDPSDFDGTVGTPNGSIAIQSGIAGFPIIPGFTIQGESALTNTPGSITGAFLQTSYQARASTGGTIVITASATGFSQPTASSNPLTLTSALDGNGSLTGTIVGQEWADTTNALFGMGSNTPGPQGPFNVGAAGGYSSSGTVSFNRGAGDYALTNQVTIALGAGANTTGSLESDVPAPAVVHPAINTTTGGTVIVGSGSKLTDTANLSGGNNPSGTITFTLYSPADTVVDTETVTVNGNGTYTTPGGYLPTATGTYQWVASYSGDSNNASATSGKGDEPEGVSPASPNVTTNPGGTVIIGSGAKLTDSATLASGYNPSGTITFTLYSPADTAVDTETVTVNGNGTYTTPGGYLPTATGTYQWVASYSGDSNNNPAISGKGDEPESVIPASPAINTIPGGTVIIGSGVKLTDWATLAGGYNNPSGTITFTLYSPADTAVDTETVTVNGNGTYTTPGGYLPTATGTYQWVASYSGDSNNASATSGKGDEPEGVSPASPNVTTNPGGTVIIGSGAKLTDSATLASGYNPSGTITFTLYSPADTAVDTETVTVNGNGTYTTPGGYLPTATGTYQWVASYSGDSNNNPAISGKGDEPESAIPASPAINTVAGGVVVIGSGTKLTDTANLTGGYGTLGGTVTFTLYSPSNVAVYTDTVTVSGTGTYDTSVGDHPGGYLPTVVGTYLWTARYSGDNNNTGATDNGQNENEAVKKASPTINTVAGGTVLIGSGTKLTDTADLEGAYNPTGTIAFTLFFNNSQVDTETVTVTHNGTYTTPSGYLPTAAGTYVWTATYSGDANNTGASDNGQNESEAVTPASPAINTVAGGTVVIGSGTKLTDTANLTGGYGTLGGTVTFTLYSPSNVAVYTDTVTVSGTGTYDTSVGDHPGGYLPTVVGTYLWTASYSGDANNNGASDNGQNENEAVTPASPAINTVAGGTVVIGSGTKLTDTANLTGGYGTLGGTVTFTLYSPSNVAVYTDTVTVSGTGTYDTSVGDHPGGYLPTVVGTYLWTASYSGDANNNGASDNGQNENEAVNKASPAINTVAGGTVVIGSGTKLTDTANLTGGYGTLGGTVTFTLYSPSNVAVYTDTVTVSGTGTYDTSVGDHPGGYLPTVVGTYLWTARYSGDNNNTGATDSGQNENEAVTKVGPAITTTPSLIPGTSGGVVAGQFATIGFWHNQNGQAVIKSFNGSTSSTALGNWLASSFPHLFGASNPYTGTSLAGLTNTQVAAVYLNLWTPSGLTKNTYVQAFAVALGVYADTTSLGGQSLLDNGKAVQFGFVVTAGGGGSSTFNVGNDGAAFGVANNTSLTVAQIMQIVDANFTASSGLFYGGDQSKTSGANDVLNGINSVGDIPGGSSSLTSNGDKLIDSATLSGGYNPTGTVTFYLFAPGVTPNGTNSNNVYSDTVTVNGNGVYDTSTGTNAGGYQPTTTGTYEWVAVYSGDANNSSVTSPFGSEPFAVGSASPTINTIDGGTIVIGSGAKLTDSAMLAGGSNPTGTVTFYLFAPGVTPNGTNSNNVYSDTVTVNGNGTYSTATGNHSGGYLPTATGAYQWVAVYSGDSNNGTAASPFGDEPETVNLAGPAINTVAGGTVAIGSGTNLTDTAVLSGGYNPTGTITFTLYSPSNVGLYTDVVTVTGNGTYTTATGTNPGGYLPTVAGTYLWTATYGGDSNNSSVHDNGQNENETVLAPGIDIEKTTNGPTNTNPVAPDYDNEDAPNGPGVPVLTAGSSVTWTYKVTNTGAVAFPTSQVVVTDDNGTPADTSDDLSTTNSTIVFDHVQTGDADNILEPGEVWIYKATGTVQSLTVSSGTSATFDMSGSSSTTGAVGNIRAFSAGGVMVNTSGFSRDKSTGAWAPAYLGSYGGGLGVTDTSEDGTAPNHAVDNSGRNNYVLFEFSENVIVDSALLGYVSGDSDMTVWIGAIPGAFNSHQTLSDSLLSSLGFTEVNTGGSSTRTADLNAGLVAGNVLVIAAKTDEANDFFKVQTLTVKKTQPSVYENKGTVTVPGATDSDLSHYKNAAAGAIGGHKYLDVSGNGLNTTAGYNSPADVPLQGVTVYLDLNNNGALNSGEPTQVTDVNGAYLFTGLTSGTYYVREVVPAGFIRTNPSTSDNYKVVLTTGGSSSGNDFANAETCDANTITNVSFKVVHSDGTSATFTDLRGNTRQGDVIKVTFTVNVPSGDTHDVTFVSYTAPGATFDANTASQQQIYDLATGTFGPGVHYLTVSVPNCYYQVDFVCGLAIDQLGPNGSNVFYTPQSRLESADNGGTRACGPCQVTGEFATVGFWKNSTTGQAVLKSFNGGSTHTELGNWLAATFPNLFGVSNPYTGANLAGKTNAQIATIFSNLSTSTTAKMTYAQAFAVALGIYADTRSLGGQSLVDNGYALAYGFNISLAGGGASTFSIGSNTAAFSGLGSTPTVLQIMQKVNANFSSSTGNFYGGNSTTTTAANNVLSGINAGGDIALVTDGSTSDAADQVLASVLHPLLTGVMTVAVDEITGDLAAAEQARMDDVISHMNDMLGSRGVTLVEIQGDDSVDADVHLHLASTSVIGGVDQGVLGVTSQAGAEITIVTGWNYFLGTDPSAIGDSQYDFETVVSHELGHALGLGHSTDADSAMYPYLATAQVRHDLTANDLAIIDNDGGGSPEPLLAASFAHGHSAESDGSESRAALPIHVDSPSPMRASATPTSIVRDGSLGSGSFVAVLGVAGDHLPVQNNLWSGQASNSKSGSGLASVPAADLQSSFFIAGPQANRVASLTQANTVATALAAPVVNNAPPVEAFEQFADPTPVDAIPAARTRESREMPLPSTLSPEASDACFGACAPALEDQEDWGATLLNAETAPPADQGAALAGLFVGLGGYWSLHRERTDETVQRRRRIV